MDVRCELVTKKSKKTGKEFNVLELTFPNGYTKWVFLDQAEQYLLMGL